MIIVLLGASGSGKSTIENIISENYGFEKIISFTTRPKRDTEVDGKDYYFTTNEIFKMSIKNNHFAEWDEYSQNRLYGTLKPNYESGNKVVVLTPNGLRQVKRNCKDVDIFSVLVEANLGTRIKRYIDRCGVDKFNFDDKNEVAARVERDYSMFLGLKNEVDMVVHNDEGTDISKLSKEIYENAKKKENGR